MTEYKIFRTCFPNIVCIIDDNTDSGCESEQFVKAVEYIWLPNTMIVALILPWLVKKKLSRYEI